MSFASASALADQSPDKALAAALVNSIAEHTAQLIGKPRKIELTSEKALRVRNAVKRGDYATAAQIAAGVLADSRLQNWRFYPFTGFIKNVSDLSDPNFESRLDAWVANSPNDAIPLLARAQYFYDLGWRKRGNHFSRDTQASDLAAFKDYMVKAYADAEAAIRANDQIPYGFYLKLQIMRAHGASQELAAFFEQAIAKYPNYYELYDTFLMALDPKWGGSVAAMYEFVDQYAGGAEEYSPLKLLYVSLYRHLLNVASTACSRGGRGQVECVAAEMQKMVSPQLPERVLAALQLYDHTDAHQFSVAVDDVLSDMLETRGGAEYSGEILQWAADSMHSDIRLKEDKPGQNNYVIDKDVAISWYMKGFCDNALTKYREALNDIKSAKFPDEEERTLAIADIYKSIAEVYSWTGQYPDMIAYENAATALGARTGDEHFVCFGYYQLKNYEAAIEACTKAIDQTGSLSAFYWRGRANKDSGQIDAALRDFTAVAESENDFRPSAAIEVSMIYFSRNDTQDALNVLNKYTYLYNERSDSKSNIAVSYNNRCYAYMQLGKLDEALDDCIASLRYGSLPDAYRKQQELIKRITQRGTHPQSSGSN